MGDKISKQVPPEEQEKLKEYSIRRYQFPTKGAFIITKILCSFEPPEISAPRNFSSVNWVQLLVCEIIIILPLNFTMNLIGHYTRSSCIAVGWVSPICSGFSYTMMVDSIISIIKCFLMIRIVLLYFINFVYWSSGSIFLSCNFYKDLPIFCFDCSTLKSTIVNQNNIQSYPVNSSNICSHIFYSNIVETGLPLPPNLHDIEAITIVFYIFLTIALPVILYKTSQLKFKYMYKIIKPVVICLVLLYIIIDGMLLIPEGAIENTLNYFKATSNLELYINYKSWFTGIMDVLAVFAPTTVEHITLAAMLDPKLDTLQITFESYAVVKIVDMLKVLAFVEAQGILYTARNVLYSEDTLSPALESIAVLIPTAANYLFTGDTIVLFFFYILLALAWITVTSMKIQIFYDSLTELIPSSTQYRKYIYLSIEIVLLLLSVTIFNQGTLSLSYKCLENAQFIPIWFSVILFTIFLYWFYGVTNLGDDYHFKVGHPLFLIFKICLSIVPAILLLTMIVGIDIEMNLVAEEFKRYSIKHKIMYITVQVIFLIPFVFGILYELIKFVLKKNVMLIVKPRERWGDPDAKVRNDRKKYPPRLETKFRRRFDYCIHRCLRYNKVLHLLDLEEQERRAALLDISVELVQEKDYLYNIIRRFLNINEKTEKD